MTSDPGPRADGPARLSLERIEEAARTIDPVFLNSPQYVSDALSEEVGLRTLVKVETANPIRCFKGRGADYYVASLAPGSELLTASAGNFGQAMAYACRRRGIALTVYASHHANRLKLERMRALGARVVLHGDDFDGAKAEAKRVARESGLPMVEDGLEPRISEGAGTMAFELLAGGEPFEALVVPLGNGAMLGGVARYLKAKAPDIEVISVVARAAPCMERSWRAGRVIETESADTIADGIGIRTPVPEALADIGPLVDDILEVGDEMMVDAMRLCHRHLGLVIEPAGAAGLAGLLAAPTRFAGLTVATILCGGNLTTEQTARWLT